MMSGVEDSRLGNGGEGVELGVSLGSLPGREEPHGESVPRQELLIRTLVVALRKGTVSTLVAVCRVAACWEVKHSAPLRTPSTRELQALCPLV